MPRCKAFHFRLHKFASWIGRTRTESRMQSAGRQRQIKGPGRTSKYWCFMSHSSRCRSSATKSSSLWHQHLQPVVETFKQLHVFISQKEKHLKFQATSPTCTSSFFSRLFFFTVLLCYVLLLPTWSSFGIHLPRSTQLRGRTIGETCDPCVFTPNFLKVNHRVSKISW